MKKIILLVVILALTPFLAIADDHVQKQDKANSTECYYHCLSRGGIDSTCQNTCKNPKNESLSQQEDKGNSPKGGNFNGVDYACFKECRKSGDSYQECENICRRDAEE